MSIPSWLRLELGVRVEGSIGTFHQSSKRERGEGRGHRIYDDADAL